MKAPALVIAMPHKGMGGGMSEDDGDGPDKESPEEDDSDEMEAADRVAEVIGVPEDKRQDLYDALRAFVKACASNY